jgi:P-type Cu+ transporter
LVGIDNILLGIIVISDTIKENAKEAIQSLKSQEIEVIILTRDNERITKAVTSKLNIDRVIAEVFPH